jgi:hypothetical protein
VNNKAGLQADKFQVSDLQMTRPMRGGQPWSECVFSDGERPLNAFSSSRKSVSFASRPSFGSS